MDKKRFFGMLKFVLFGLGAFLILSSEAGITGAVIGVNIDSPVTSFIGFLMILGCVVLFMAGLTLEEKARRKRFKDAEGEYDLGQILEKALDDAGAVEEVHVDIPLSHMYSSVTPTDEYKEIDGEKLRVYEGTSVQDGKTHKFTMQPMKMTRLDLGDGKYVSVPTERRIRSEDREGETYVEEINWIKAVKETANSFREHGIDPREVIRDIIKYKSKAEKK